MSIKKVSIEQSTKVITIGHPGMPSTLVSKELHTGLTALSFINGKSVVGQIDSEDNNYITFTNALTHIQERYNHKCIASIKNVALFEQIFDVTEHTNFNSRQYKQMLRRRFVVIQQNETVNYVNKSDKSSIVTLHTEDIITK